MPYSLTLKLLKVSCLYEWSYQTAQAFASSAWEDSSLLYGKASVFHYLKKLGGEKTRCPAFALCSDNYIMLLEHINPYRRYDRYNSFWHRLSDKYKPYRPQFCKHRHNFPWTRFESHVFPWAYHISPRQSLKIPVLLSPISVYLLLIFKEKKRRNPLD